MKSKQVSLNELPSKSTAHTVRVKVIKKHAAYNRPGKTKFQRLILKDDEGTTMRACIFGVDVDIYNNILHEDKFYDISNVSIKDVDQQYALYPNEKQMYLTNSTSIKIVDSVDIQNQFQPKYLDISAIKQDDHPNCTFDVLAIVIKVGWCEKIRTRYGTEVDICRVHITDDKYNEVMLVSVWNSLAFDCQNILSNKSLHNVVGFTGLKITNFNGFSLATTAESQIILQPPVPRAVQLKTWSLENFKCLEERKNQLLKVEPQTSNITTFTLKQAIEMEAEETLAGVMIKIFAFIHELSQDDVRTSLGCIHCGKNCGGSLDDKIECRFCKKTTPATAKIYLDFKATDGSSTIQLVANTKLAEKILNVEARTLYSMTTEARKDFFDKLVVALRKKKVYMLLTPVIPLLVEHKVLKWILKEVVDE